MRVRCPLLSLVLALVAGSAAAQAPQVVALTPRHGDRSVDAAAVKQLVVEFDRDMLQRSYSFCGGGPTFPKVNGVRWLSSRRIALDVTLTPDTDYVLGLNCAGSTGFAAADGTTLQPLPWHFSTARAAAPLDPAAARAQSAASFEALVRLLDEAYSYREDRALTVDAALEVHAQTLRTAADPRAFAAAAAQMLGGLGDLHVQVRLGNRSFPVVQPTADPLVHESGLRAVVGAPRAVGRGVREGQVAGFPYLELQTFGAALDVDALEARLAALREAPGLILDVRRNGGGDELLARRVAAWFVAGEAVYAAHRTRTGPGPDGFGPRVDRTITGNPAGRRFAGPVVVLTGPRVMSSAEAFLLMMKQGEDVELVGTLSAGSSGNPQPHELPNGVVVWLPSWRALRPDGTCFEGRGIAPDVSVDVDLATLDTADPILSAGLARLRARAGR